MATKIEIKDLTYTYGKGAPYEKKALNRINLSLESGAVTGLIGHTGSGKSTLVQMLNGLLRPDSGEVLLDGKNIWQDPKKIRDVRFKVGLVMQYPEYQLFDETVADDIAFGPKNMGMTADEIKETVLKSARFCGLTEDTLSKSPFDLSGGQKRRVALAGVMAMKPEVLVLDEPCAGLDPGGRRDILEGILNFRDESGTTVVIVSHSMEDMAMYCDRLAVLSKGTVIAEGKPEEVFEKSEELIKSGLDVPEINKVAKALKTFGIDIGSGVYTVEYATRKLLKSGVAK